jgi:hypothetical protein
VKLFQKLSVVNQDTVWLKVVSLWNPIHKLNPPADGLQIIKVGALRFVVFMAVSVYRDIPR